MAAYNFPTTRGGKMDGFEIGDRVTWFDGHNVREANVVRLTNSTVVLDIEIEPGVLWEIWPDYLRKIDN